MSSEAISVSKVKIPTKREVSLAGVQAWAIILIILGVVNGIAGIIVGDHMTVPTENIYGEVTTKVSLQGYVFAGGAVGVGLVLVCVGFMGLCLANALKPDSDQPVR